MSSKSVALSLAIAVTILAAPGAQTPATSANTTITAVDGLKVGSVTLPGGTTGCTVILVDGEGAVGGVSQRGGAL